MKCVICDKEIIGYGNNARPINDGQCCDECNINIVIPERTILLKMQEAFNEIKENKEEAII